MHFSFSPKWASGLQERHTEHLRAWPLLYCRIFLITTRFFVKLMTGRVKNNWKYSAFPLSRTLLFQFNKICSVTRLKFTIINTYGLSLKMKIYHTVSERSKTRYLERLSLCKIREYRPKAKRRSCQSQTWSHLYASSICHVWSEEEHFISQIFPGNFMYL